MISEIPDNVKKNIITGVKTKFNFDVEEDIINFLQEFQSKVSAEKGFANKETVRMYNLAVFEFNPKRVDSKNTMKRLLNKHDGNTKEALKEFRKLGKTIAIEEKRNRKEKRDNKIIKPGKHDKIKSINSPFTAR